MGKYQVVVGNLGTVYDGNNVVEARETFTDYVQQSKSGAGRVAWEDVTLFQDGDVLDDYTHADHAEADIDIGKVLLSKLTKDELHVLCMTFDSGGLDELFRDVLSPADHKLTPVTATKRGGEHTNAHEYFLGTMEVSKHDRLIQLMTAVSNQQLPVRFVPMGDWFYIYVTATIEQMKLLRQTTGYTR